MALSPEAQAQIAASEQRDRGRAWLANESSLVDSRFGARTLGDMTIIDEGFQVWSHLDGRNDARIDHQGEAQGGVVLAVTDKLEGDPETGEVTSRRAFYCYNPFLGGPDDYRAFNTLTEAQINLEACGAPDMAMLRRVYRRFAHSVGRQKGVAAHQETELMIYGGRLAAIVAGERGA